MCLLPPTCAENNITFVHHSTISRLCVDADSASTLTSQSAIIFHPPRIHLHLHYRRCIMLDDAPTDDGGPPPPAANASTPIATLASSPSTLTTSPALNTGETDSEDVVFAPMQKIWDCIMICQTMVNDTKKRWKCLWCDRVFTPVHATRALTHVLKVKKSDIAPCTAKIQAPYLQRYQDLSETLSERAAA